MYSAVLFYFSRLKKYFTLVALSYCCCNSEGNVFFPKSNHKTSQRTASVTSGLLLSPPLPYKKATSSFVVGKPRFAIHYTSKNAKQRPTRPCSAGPLIDFAHATPSLPSFSTPNEKYQLPRSEFHTSPRHLPLLFHLVLNYHRIHM